MISTILQAAAAKARIVKIKDKRLGLPAPLLLHLQSCTQNLFNLTDNVLMKYARSREYLDNTQLSKKDEHGFPRYICMF